MHIFLVSSVALVRRCTISLNKLFCTKLLSKSFVSHSGNHPSFSLIVIYFIFLLVALLYEHLLVTLQEERYDTKKWPTIWTVKVMFLYLICLFNDNIIR